MSEDKVRSVYKVTDAEILGFFKEHRFLSNFHLCDIEYEGIVYPSTEHAYQAAKSLDPDVRKQFLPLTCSKAKQLGREIEIRPDWKDIKIDVMLALTRIKYYDHPDLMEKLLNTGERWLEETNYWGDIFWGVYNGKGENWLGKCLMRVREEIYDTLTV